MKQQQWFLGGGFRMADSEECGPLLTRLGKVVVAAILVSIVFYAVVTVVFAEPVPPWVAIAQHEIGHGETTGDNRGADVRRYLRGSEDMSWCAAFVSWCLDRSGSGTSYILRARNFLKTGTIVKDPHPGDLIVFWRGNRNSATGHVGIVESVTKNTITTIEGNVGAFPAKVKRITYQKNDIKRFLGFVKIEVRDAM